MAKFELALNLYDEVKNLVIDEINDRLDHSTLDSVNPEELQVTVLGVDKTQDIPNEHGNILVEVEVIYNGDDEAIAEAYRELIMDFNPPPEVVINSIQDADRCYKDCQLKILYDSGITFGIYKLLDEDVQELFNQKFEALYRQKTGQQYNG